MEISSAFQNVTQFDVSCLKKKVIAIETRPTVKIHDFPIKPGRGWTPYMLVWWTVCDYVLAAIIYLAAILSNTCYYKYDTIRE